MPASASKLKVSAAISSFAPVLLLKLGVADDKRSAGIVPEARSVAGPALGAAIPAGTEAACWAFIVKGAATARTPMAAVRRAIDKKLQVVCISVDSL